MANKDDDPSSSPDYIKGNEEAYRQVREAQLQRSADKKSAEDSESPDTEASMNRLFARQDRESSDIADMARVAEVRRAQQKALSDQAQLKSGGYVKDYASKTTIGQGAAGIVSSAGPDKAIKLGIGATVEEMKKVADMSNAMQAHRRAVKEYERREREKKKNDGGLTAARQKHSAPDFFPNYSFIKIGAVSFSPMSFVGFSGAMPISGVGRSMEQGWCQTDPSGGITNTLNRNIVQSGRNTFGSYVGGGG